MTKAEAAALKAYPVSRESTPLGPVHVDVNEYARNKYQEGYEQAEKDLELTWEDIETICNIESDLWEEVCEGKREDSREPYYTAVLRRYNESKSK